MVIPEKISPVFKSNTNVPEYFQSLFQSVADVTDDAVISINTSGEIIIWNKAAETIFGYSSEFIIGKKISLIIPENLSEQNLTITNKTISGESIKNFETTRLDKNGNSINVSINFSAIKDTKGKVLGLLELIKNITEKKENEKKLKDSLKIIADYKYALDKSSIVAITNQKGIITYVNENFCKISKYDADELIGQDHRIINSGHHTKEFIRSIWTTIANGNIWQGEIKNKAKDGSYYWVNTTIVPFLDEQEKPYQYVAIRKDITLRKENEKKLKESLKEISDYKHALDESSIVAITNQKGVITYVNDNFCKISKYSSEELVGQDHRIINSGHHSKEFIRNLWVTIANGKIWRGELKNKAKDGSYYWVDTTIVPFLNDEGKPYQYIAIRNDISSRKKTEEELVGLNITLDKKVQDRTNALAASQKKLEESLERANFLATIANSIQDPVISMDNDRNINKWNDAAEKLFGWKSAEVVGKSVKDVLNIEYLTIPREEIYRLLQTEGSCQGEAIAYTKLGKKLYLLATASALKDINNNTVGALAVCRDITERKVAEEALYKLNNDLEMLVVERTKEVYASEEKYKNLFNNNPLPAFLIDYETLNFLDVNQKAIDLYGYSREEWLSMDIFDSKIRPQEEIEKAKTIDYSSFRAGSDIKLPGVWKFIAKNGNIILAEITSANVTINGKIVRLSILDDVTEKKAIEEKLIASEKNIVTFLIITHCQCLHLI